MKNKCFIFMIILFSIFMPSFIANAESYNIDNYDDLINAINNDNTNKLIKLTSDINVTKENGMTIKNGQEVTLELNGHVLSLNATNTSTTYLFYNNGSLTIKDNTDTNKDGTGLGKLLFKAENPDLKAMPGYASNAISNKGNLYIESGTIGNNTTAGGATYGIDTYTNNTKLIINGGKIYSTVAYGIRQYIDRTSSNYVEVNGGHIVGNSAFHLFVTNGSATVTTKITGGTFESESIALYVNDYLDAPNNVKVDISGGTFKGKEYGFFAYSKYSDVNISGGNFISTMDSKSQATGYGAYIYSITNDVTISGGAFTGKDYGAYIYTYGPDIKITGGTFTSDAGYGTYIYAYNSGTKITGGTYKGAYAAYIYPIYKPVTISGGAFEGTTTGAYINEYYADLNITGGTFKGNTYGSYVQSTYGNTTIDGGTFDGTTYAIYYRAPYSDEKLLTINDGTLKGKNALYYYGKRGTDKRIILNDGLYDGYIYFYEEYDQTIQNSLINSIEVNDGKYSKDLYFIYYDGTEWLDATSGNFINGGYYKNSGKDSYWGYYINSELTPTGKLQTAPEGFKYSVGNKIILDPNYDNKETEIIYSLSDGKMSELYTPERDKYNFIEWNTKSDGTGKTVTKDSIIKEEKTLYAIWKIKPGEKDASVRSETFEYVNIDKEKVLNDILTDEDKENIDNGKSVNIELLVETIKPTETSTDYKLINDKAKEKDLKIGKFIDISLIKKTEDEEDIKIEETNNELEITISIPEELINEDKKTITRDYSILRSHNGEVTVLTPTYDSNNETLSFKTDKFSLYSIAYKDTKIKNPKTGDKISLYITIGLISLIGLSATLFIKKEN